MSTSATPELQEADKDELSLALEGSKEGEDDKGDKGDTKDEGKTDEEKAADADAAKEAERLKPVEKEDGTMETDEEAKARVETEDAAAQEPTETEELRSELRDLRQILRTSKRDSAQQQAKIERLEKRAVAVVEEGEEGEEEDGEKKVVKKEEPLSRVEELQGAIGQIATDRGTNLDILLATMEQSAEYKDIREVCSRANFDDVFEAITSEMVKDTGKDANELLLEVELNVWNKANPYEYMYGLIKKYHPDYTEKGTGKKDEKKDEKKIVVAPGSIADKGGDADVKGGWTAKRIDDLPEGELDKVPKDIYEKYMNSELD